MKQEIDLFIAYLQNEKKTSENTRLSYQRDLKKLAGFLEQEAVTRVDAVEEKHLEAYLCTLKEQGFKAATISRNIASMKAFFSFLEKDDYLCYNSYVL